MITAVSLELCHKSTHDPRRKYCGFLQNASGMFPEIATESLYFNNKTYPKQSLDAEKKNSIILGKTYSYFNI